MISQRKSKSVHKMESHRLRKCIDVRTRMRHNEKSTFTALWRLGRTHSSATQYRLMHSLFIFHCLPKWAFNIYERILTTIYHREWVCLRQNQFIHEEDEKNQHHQQWRRQQPYVRSSLMCKGFFSSCLLLCMKIWFSNHSFRTTHNDIIWWMLRLFCLSLAVNLPNRRHDVHVCFFNCLCNKIPAFMTM